MTRAMITDPKVYFEKGCGRCDRWGTPECSALRWAEGLAVLRRICLEAGLEEHAKWGHPTYMAHGRNIVIFGAFRDNFRLTFFKAALMKDPEGVLERQGENTQNPDMIWFTSDSGPVEMEGVIRAYIAEAVGYAQKGIKPEKVARDLDMPEELVEALDADPELAEAWEALTPGRQRSYLFNLGQAKQSATRVARIAKFRDKIIAGKGAQER